MKLISNSEDLQREFKRLSSQYGRYHWLAAWAGTGSYPFRDLKRQKSKIERIVVGLHFCQTHPDFIKEFQHDRGVRFVKQTEGTFHPKLYLFSNGPDEWELLLGSANFTKDAFTRNTEACILVNDGDRGAQKLYVEAMRLIDGWFKKGQTFDSAELMSYRMEWSLRQNGIKTLSSPYKGMKPAATVKMEAGVMGKNWSGFMREVSARAQPQILQRRLKVVESARRLFTEHGSFRRIGTEERKLIAGIPNKSDMDGAEDWGFFGSMKGAGLFKKKVIDNDILISRALDKIPLRGRVSKIQYREFINLFSTSLEGKYLATATRLLSMKRPDTFLCLDSKNRVKLCKDFGVKQSGIDYERYWDEIVERIQQSDWWMNPKPRGGLEKGVSLARAAFLDVVYYVG